VNALSYVLDELYKFVTSGSKMLFYPAIRVGEQIGTQLWPAQATTPTSNLPWYIPKSPFEHYITYDPKEAYRPYEYTYPIGATAVEWQLPEWKPIEITLPEFKLFEMPEIDWVSVGIFLMILVFGAILVWGLVKKI